MAELLVIIKVRLFEISLLALTVVSDLDSMFMGFIPHFLEQLWANSKIKNKVNLGTKLILNLIF